ncbi:MAG: hypothetical protein ACJ8C4_09335 [Gemmataceae bacterium]
MGKYADRQWYMERLSYYTAQYGAVPPPWVYADNSHPHSIRWRMGSGETMMMVFDEWWGQQNWSEPERVDYFRKWPPPPRWIPWMSVRIWNLHPWDCDGQFDYAPWYKRIAKLGFAGVDDVERDLDDPKWLELESAPSD